MSRTGEYDEEPCPFCGTPVKVLPNHLPCPDVPDVEVSDEH